MDAKTKLALELGQTIYANTIAELTEQRNALAAENEKFRNALLICKKKFDFMREIRGSDGALEDAVKAVDEVLNTGREI